ncbi:MAG: class I SAM-dependent methyltransferase [Chitinophagales bacterium]
MRFKSDGIAQPLYCVNINNIQFEDNSFDRIICSHVLEHIETDEKAISELYRILKPGGIALIAVPTYGEVTEEDLSFTPAQRKLEYGINIHVRLYGTDISKKLEKV